MRNIVISVDHRDETGKHWADSYIQNKTIPWEDDQTIHEAIAEALKEHDGCDMAYKGMPRGNVYRDKKDGTSYVCGYWYRTKHLIADRSANYYRENVPFTTWVTVHGEEKPLELVELPE